MGGVVAPLPGWNVRGYSYGERQADGQLHPGADLNVGGGDDDLGRLVVCFAGGVVRVRREWDGWSYGFGNAGLVEHIVEGAEGVEGAESVVSAEGAGGAGSGAALRGVRRLWTLYAHLDHFDPAFQPGAWYEAGQRIGACGKSGRQRWAHLHFEVRYEGPPAMPLEYWGGWLSYQALSERYADPFTLLRVLGRAPGGAVGGAIGGALGGAPRHVIDGALASTRRALEEALADREYNYQLKMTFEAYLRELEGRRRLKRGTVDRLIASMA